MPNIGVREWWAAGQAILSGNVYRYKDGAHFSEAFERRLGEAIGSKHALAVNSGTAALVCALAAAGVGPGDEVLVPAYTWMATAAAPVMVGAVPVLVDIDETLTIDPADIERKITPQTKAIIPVHMINLPCDMDRIMAVAKKHNLLVIEDACQAVGVPYKMGFCGAIGDAGAFSFNSYKNMNIGEGGAFVTNDDALYARARNYHDLGAPIRGHEDTYNQAAFVGHNMRVTELQTAMLGVQLSKLMPMMRRLKVRRAAMAEVFEANGLKLAPHNDSANAMSLVVLFDTAAEAIEFAKRPQVTRIMDSSKHIYTNWEAILARRTFNDKMNPWKWAEREIDYTADTCKRSLDILSRACRVALGQRYPTPIVRIAAQRLARGAKPALA
jgi:dTDP-4-amino-4,6-dideoxygalactose transaminase